MSGTRPKVLLVGATGVFGRRLARHLADWPQIDLILAARRLGPLEAFAVTLAGPPHAVAFDRGAPEALSDLKPLVVIDCAGPFQGADYTLPRAALAAGAHYLDIADGRDFVAGFTEALNDDALRAGRLAMTGCSSTPALTHAALDMLVAGWTRIDIVAAAISPGAKAPRGEAVIGAILSWAGRPVRLFAGGRWRERPGWSDPRRERFPGVGHRWTALAKTPDLDLLPGRFHPTTAATFRAGVASPILHLGLWLLTFLPRWRLIGSLRPGARPLAALAGLFAGLGSDRGGMVVAARGAGPDSAPREARWSLAADPGTGPSVPTAPAAAMLRSMLQAPPASGARVCAGHLMLEQITAELPARAFRYTTRCAAPARAALFPALLGEAFDRMPDEVRAVHHGVGTEAWTGLARARRGGGPIGLAAMAFGLPPSGRYADICVSIAADGDGETWTRRFGANRFQSRISRDTDPLQFRESLGPFSFVFDPAATARGMRWRLTGWRCLGIPAPLALAPRVRAFSHARNGAYRFHVVIAVPVFGIVCAYAGRLERRG